jgi:hypothetical protein
MSYTKSALVDDAIEAFINAEMARTGSVPDRVTASTLAAYAGVDRPTMSHWLQMHRNVQGRSGGYRPRYYVASFSYARAAQWLILGVPGSDPWDQQDNRIEHTKWTAADIGDRFAREVRCEVKAALRGAPKDPRIESVIGMLQANIEAQVALVLAML